MFKNSSQGASKRSWLKQKRSSREVDSSQGTSKRKQNRENDSSQGTSTRCRLKQKHTSRSQSDGQLGMGSESSKIKEKGVCREQGGADASKGDPERLIFPLYEGEKPNARQLTEAERAEIQPAKRCFRRLGSQRKRTMTPSMVEMVKRIHRKYAETALEFYEQSQGDEFEIEQVLDCNCATVRHPSYKILKLWLHISFTAKSKSDGSTKHFFGELYKNDGSGKKHAAYCATFEPSDEPGFEHGCVFCPPGLKNHPADGYLVGCPPWFVPGMKLCREFK